MSTLNQMGTVGTMSIGAGGHCGKMGNWSQWALGKMSTRANRQLRQMGIWDRWTLGQMGIGRKRPPGKMSIKANGLWAIGANEHFGQMGV